MAQVRLVRAIDHGLFDARHAVVIVSRPFLWICSDRKALDAPAARRRVVPILHGIDAARGRPARPRPTPPAPRPDPELLKAARSFKAALDRALAQDVERGRRWEAVRAGELARAEFDAWYEAQDDALADAVEEAQEHLDDRLRYLGLNAVILDGLLFLGPWTDRYTPMSNWPDRFAIAEMARVVNLDAAGGAR